MESRVLEFLAVADWSQATLAVQLGKERKAVSRWVSGESKADFGALLALAGRYGFDPMIWAEGGPRPAEVVNGPLTPLPVATVGLRGTVVGPGGAVARGTLEVDEPGIPRRVVREAVWRAWDAVADGAQAGRSVPGEIVARAFGQLSRDLALTPPSDNGASVPTARAAGD